MTVIWNRIFIGMALFISCTIATALETKTAKKTSYPANKVIVKKKHRQTVTHSVAKPKKTTTGNLQNKQKKVYQSNSEKIIDESPGQIKREELKQAVTKRLKARKRTGVATSNQNKATKVTVIAKNKDNIKTNKNNVNKVKKPGNGTKTVSAPKTLVAKESTAKQVQVKSSKSTNVPAKKQTLSATASKETKVSAAKKTESTVVKDHNLMAVTNKAEKHKSQDTKIAQKPSLENKTLALEVPAKQIAKDVDASKPNFIKTITLGKFELGLSLYNKAVNTINRGNYKEGVLELKNLLDTDPQFDMARLKLIELYGRDNNIMAARALLDSGLKLNPNNIDYVKLQALSLLQTGKSSNALDFLLLKHNAVEPDEDYYALLASSYYSQDMFIQAKRIYLSLLNNAPSQSKWLLGVATCEDALNEKGKALKNFEQLYEYGYVSTEVMHYVKTRINNLRAEVNRQKNNKRRNV